MDGLKPMTMWEALVRCNEIPHITHTYMRGGYVGEYSGQELGRINTIKVHYAHMKLSKNTFRTYIVLKYRGKGDLRVRPSQKGK